MFSLACIALSVVVIFFIFPNHAQTQTISPACAADVDKSGLVDISDYTVLVRNFFKSPIIDLAADIDKDGSVDLSDYSKLSGQFLQVCTPSSSSSSTTSSHAASDESMAMNTWSWHLNENPVPKSANYPDTRYDKCDDGTDIVQVHKMYYVVAYDGKKYPTWHPPVVNNPVTGVGKCYFGHEHGSDPQKYVYWNEVVQHFGKDMNGDGQITPLVINAQTGAITAGDRAGLPFGIANEKMNEYYNQENRDSIFVRHEDHVGHKIEYVNVEADMNTDVDGHDTASTHQMAQLSGTTGLNVPYYTTGSDTYQPTGVVCAHLHKFHQGTSSGDAILNNLHEVTFHSKCQSVNVNGINAPAYYPNNLVILTGMMSFGNPGEYKRFCFADRYTKVCPLGKDATGKCILTDPLLAKLPPAINSSSLGRNIVDRQCLDNWSTYNPGNNYFSPYEIWEGDLRIQTASGKTLAEHGRQWDVLDPIRFIDPSNPKGFSYNADNCAPGGAFDKIQYLGNCPNRSSNIPWNTPQSGFKGLKRTTYFGRNHISNQGGPEIVWTDPLGGNAVTTQFGSGLKQKISSLNADIQAVQSRIQSLFGGNHFLNDRAIQRRFNDGNNTVHAPN